MLGSAGALPRVGWWFPGKSTRLHCNPRREEPGLSTCVCWGMPSGLQPSLGLLVLSLTHLVWSSSSSLLAAMNFRKLLALVPYIMLHMGMIMLHIYFFLGGGDKQSRWLEIVPEKCLGHSLTLTEQRLLFLRLLFPLYCFDVATQPIFRQASLNDFAKL